jgi:hypothetical protein
MKKLYEEIKKLIIDIVPLANTIIRIIKKFIDKLKN